MDTESRIPQKDTESRIPQKLFFRIGEVCDLIKVQPHVLRYWETEFPMLAPQKNRAGQRVYRRKDVEMVLRIRDLLYEEKFTIAGARKRLAEENKKGGAPRLRPSSKEKVVEVDKELEMDLQAPDEYFESDDIQEQPTQPITPTLADKAPSVATARSAPPKQIEKPALTKTSEQAIASVIQASSEQIMSPRAQLALRVIRRDLEDLLTLLDADASIKRST
jgi:DNA-binding transcriptional MerR regulator